MILRAKAQLTVLLLLAQRPAGTPPGRFKN